MKDPPHPGQRMRKPFSGIRRGSTSYGAPHAWQFTFTMRLRGYHGSRSVIMVRRMIERSLGILGRRTCSWGRGPLPSQPVRGVRKPALEGAVKKTITLDIAGAAYKMNVDADEQHLLTLARIVNERVAALGPKAQQRASPAQLLVMVALGLADDWLSATERATQVEESTRRAIVNAIARIDRKLAADVGDPLAGHPDA